MHTVTGKLQVTIFQAYVYTCTSFLGVESSGQPFNL